MENYIKVAKVLFGTSLCSINTIINHYFIKNNITYLLLRWREGIYFRSRSEKQ